MDLKFIGEKLSELAVFRCVLKDEMMGAFLEMCEADSPLTRGAFAEALYKRSANLSREILEAVLVSENILSVKKAQGEEVGETVLKRADAELEILELASRVVSPLWDNEAIDFKSEFYSRLENIKKTGYGAFAKYNMFILEGGEIKPEEFYDDTPLSALKGYTRQKKEVMDNIKSLLDGFTAANMLLYGDAGTGKSATVKAVVNECAKDGLRLIELKKNQIDKIPYIMSALRKNPLKFIIFLDDVTFDASDDAFSTLKAVLEGSVAARAKNTVICVTSNRRHLVKESVADRAAGDLHAKDTMEEIGALTQRFGLSVIFEKPGKDAYLEILREVAHDYGIDEIDDKVLREAEAFAISKGGRSCRVAKLFAEELLRRKYRGGAR